MCSVNIVNGVLIDVRINNTIFIDVAERHIPKCKEIKAKPKPPKKK